MVGRGLRPRRNGGPIDLASGTELQTWAKTDSKEPIVVESAIGGEGTFSTATQASSETILRGAEPVGSDVAVVVNTKLTVEPARCAAFRPKTVNLRNKNNLVFADPPDSEAVAWTVARTSVAKDATGCIRVRLTGSGENVYNGPFSNGLLYVESPNGTVVSTNAPTAELIVGANSANLGTWVIGDAPSASVTLGGIYFNHNLVFRDAGTITVPSWICSSLTTRGNVEPYRLVLEGLTHLDVGTVYAGRGGDNGLGIVTIDDPASVEGCFLVGTENNDRGAVYLRGGQVRNRQNGGVTWSGIGVKTTSNGAWIQRGGTNEIAWQTWVGNTPHAYGAFIQHGGLTRVTTGGMLLVGCGGRGVFYQDGGVFTNALPIGERGDGAALGHAEVRLRRAEGRVQAARVRAGRENHRDAGEGRPPPQGRASELSAGSDGDAFAATRVVPADHDEDLADAGVRVPRRLRAPDLDRGDDGQGVPRLLAELLHGGSARDGAGDLRLRRVGVAAELQGSHPLRGDAFRLLGEPRPVDRLRLDGRLIRFIHHATAGIVRPPVGRTVRQAHATETRHDDRPHARTARGVCRGI